MSNFNTPKVESKSNPPHPQLSQRVVALLQDLEEMFHQLELDGCPAATVAHWRESTRIAAAQALAESARTNLLHQKIKQSAARLRPKRVASGFPAGSPKALDEIKGLTSQLPQSEERQVVLGRVQQLRECLLEDADDE